MLSQIDAPAIAEQSKEMAKQTRTIVYWMAGFALAVCVGLARGGFFG